jgi:D-3-phosphoglycerate dehydrogenase / 2-oxoglutarate reductase
MRVLVADKLAKSVLESLAEAGCTVLVEADAQDASLVEAIERHEPSALVVRSTKVRAEHLAAATRLSLIVRAGAGVNTIDIEGAAKRAIYVCNCPGKNAIAVAELVIGHLINMDRRIADNVAALREHSWAKKRLGNGRGLFERELAILGMGRIGREVATRANAMGMKVRAWSRSLSPEEAAELGVDWASSPAEACQGADALTVHVAKTTDTTGLVGSELLALLNDGAYVVNTARGGIVDEDALRAAIATRGLRAGLDVFTHEPSGGEGVFDDPIVDDPGVYGTHHIAASTDQASEAVGDEVVRIIAAFKGSGEALNCVNLQRRSRASHVLSVQHANRVGVLAAVLDHLQGAEVNVQGMENTIFAGGDAASALIQVSSWPGEELLERVASSENIFSASVMAAPGSATAP